MPIKGEIVTIYPTYIVGLTEFFAQLTKTRAPFELFVSNLHDAFKQKALYSYTGLPSEYCTFFEW